MCGFRDIPQGHCSVFPPGEAEGNLGAAPGFPDGCRLPSGLGSPSLLDTTGQPRRCSFAWPGALRGAMLLSRMAGPIHARLDLSGGSLPGPRGESLLFHGEQRSLRGGGKAQQSSCWGPRGQFIPAESSHSILASCLPSIQLLFFNNRPPPGDLSWGRDWEPKGPGALPPHSQDLPAHGQTHATLGAKKAPHSPVSVWERQNPDPAWASEYHES